MQSNQQGKPGILPNHFHYKVILTGHQAVGKSSLLHRIAQSKFQEDYKTTIGVDFKKVVVTLPPNKQIYLQIWDTAGQEKFKGLTKSYFQGCHGCITVYDITQPHTLEYAKAYIETALQFGIKSECIYLLGNKHDLEEEDNEKVRESIEEGKKQSDNYGINFEAVSAKTGKNVHKFITDLGVKLLSECGELKPKDSSHPKLKIENENERGTCKC